MTREHQMIPAGIRGMLGAYWATFTFNTCRCGRVEVVRHDNWKWFSFAEIVWRKLMYSKQFKINPTLFIKADLGHNAVPTIVRVAVADFKKRPESANATGYSNHHILPSQRPLNHAP
ncbi:hypothetical protein KGQ27_00855 [Patescibacteria group bacterium]|nr:hypothetical protein [Patescibacteria group bacterium]MDE1946896.1 hypothetical protein [Patescibacteria group bacterium]MDE2010716.1 hypothetical protein [Patescibacteria group bacterium]MDE2232678.1 hypothetical protein [Patescibacteria group bacterium]